LTLLLLIVINTHRLFTLLSALVDDDVFVAQEVKSMEIATGTPNQCNSSWQRSSKVMLEKKQDLEQ